MKANTPSPQDSSRSKKPNRFGRASKSLGLALAILLPCIIFAIVMSQRDDQNINAQVPEVAATEMPSGWEGLEADQFIDAAETLFQANTQATDEHKQAVAQHAWSHFLNNETFISTADWTTVQTMVAQFAGRQNLLAGTPNATVEANRTQLRERLAARLQASPNIVGQGSFEELKSLTGSLKQTGFSETDMSAHFASWMDANAWQGLAMADQADLYEGVAVDQLDFAHMSARWTGSITAPTSDAYTFELVRNYIKDPHFKVWIDGTLVLDSKTQERSKNDNVCQ